MSVSLCVRMSKGPKKIETEKSRPSQSNIAQFWKQMKKNDPINFDNEKQTESHVVEKNSKDKKENETSEIVWMCCRMKIAVLDQNAMPTVRSFM